MPWKSWKHYEPGQPESLIANYSFLSFAEDKVLALLYGCSLQYKIILFAIHRKIVVEILQDSYKSWMVYITRLIILQYV